MSEPHPIEEAPLDVRRGLTSASNAAADRLCPGRHFAQRGFPRQKESKDAAAGTLIHRAFAGENVDLDRMQRKTLNRGRYLETEMVSRFFGQPMSDEDVMKKAHREQRFWMHVGGVPSHSSQFDAAWIKEDWSAALIEDLKGLFGDVEDATENEQLRDEAAIYWENFGVTSVSVFINQPNVRWKLEDQVLVTYDAEQLKRAHAEMKARVLASNNIKSPRVPGIRQCRFCRAAGTAQCPESQEAMLAACKTPKFDEATATPKERGEWVTLLKVSEKAIKKRLEEAKAAIVENPKWADGWHVPPGDEQRELTDVLAADKVAMDYFGEDYDGATFWKSCAKLSVPKMEDWFASVTGQEPAAAKANFALLFGHLIAKKRKAGSLEILK